MAQVCSCALAGGADSGPRRTGKPGASLAAARQSTAAAPTSSVAQQKKAAAVAAAAAKAEARTRGAAHAVAPSQTDRPAMSASQRSRLAHMKGPERGQASTENANPTETLPKSGIATDLTHEGGGNHNSGRATTSTDHSHAAPAAPPSPSGFKPERPSAPPMSSAEAATTAIDAVAKKLPASANPSAVVAAKPAMKAKRRVVVIEPDEDLFTRGPTPASRRRTKVLPQKRTLPVDEKGQDDEAYTKGSAKSLDRPHVV